MKDDALAREVRDHYAQNPEATVDEIAANLGETPGRIAWIVNEYAVKDTGAVEHVGPGGGGGWVPAPNPQ
jgi:hypothetical protein